MRKLTSDGVLQSDNWIVLGKDEPFDSATIQAPALVYWTQAVENPLALQGRGDRGIWLDTETPEESLEQLLLDVPVIGIYFPTFTDGRGFSLARMLREHQGYQGELRALGNYMQDQLYYLRRCGFSAFAIDDNVDAESMKKSLADFSESYQAAVDQPDPLFRRRFG